MVLWGDICSWHEGSYERKIILIKFGNHLGTMKFNKEKIKSYAATAWRYYAKWSYVRRHITLFSMYLATVGAVTYGISGFRVTFNNNPDRECLFEVTSGQIGWPEVCIILLVTIAFIFIGCLLEGKSYLSQAESEYNSKLDALFDRRMDPIRKMFGFISRFDNKGPFVNGNNVEIKNVFESLHDVINGQIDNLYISAFSGMGKTRWVCEAFRDVRPGDDVYYCDKVDEARFDASFSALIEEYIGKDAIVVLDDCNALLFDKYLLKVQQSKSKIRLIGMNNDTSDTPVGVNAIFFDYQALNDVVQAIVDLRLAPRLKEAYSNTIIELAEGIPYMAILMIDSLNKDDEANIRSLSRSALCRRMIHLNPNQNIDAQLKAYQTISLFSPLGYEDKDDDQLSYVRDNDNITPLVENVNRKNLFKQVIASGINQQIIEKRSTWINVRPSVLAVWLLEDWYKQCDDRRLAAIAHDIVNAPLGNLLIESFGKRFSNMPDSPSAQKLVAEITKVGGSFRSEDVVCSDMGSRLFLDMATVNPVSVSECLFSVLFFKDSQWLKDNVKDHIRRNYVWALEKLCFRKESFSIATQLLAKLAVAENEKWGNNASGIFCQLFHVALAGTQATLIERISLIEKLADYGDEFDDVIILALNHLFNYGHFHRSGGVEKVGGKKLEEFVPNGKDIVDYWERTSEFIKAWLSLKPQMADKVADAIVKQARQIGWAAGCRDILYRLIDIITEVRGNAWPEMAKVLMFAEIHHSNVMADDEKRKLHDTIEELKNKDFISKLDEAHMRFYGDYRDFEQKEKEAEAFFKSSIEDFIGEELYNDAGVLSKLMDNDQQCDFFFIRLLVRKISDNQLKALFRTAIEVLKEGDIKFSSFITLICAHTKSVEAVEYFLSELKANKFKSQYVRIISGKESKDLHILRLLAEEYIGEPDWTDLLNDYLRRAPLYDGEQMAETCSFIKEKMGNNADVCIAEYIGSYSYQDIIKTEPMLNVVEEFLVEVDEEKLSHNTVFEMNQIAEHLLKEKELPEFAKSYNMKIIKKASTERVHGQYDHIYFSLLPKYEGAIIDDVLTALADENGSYWLQMMNELGSGFSSGKGEGPLFQCNNDRIKSFCIAQAKTDFPQRLAHMVPIYEYKEDSDENKFHGFVYWLLDNLEKFNDAKAVLSGLGANIGSFSWIGSTIPLWERQRDCFTKLLNHKTPLVRDWAKRNVESLNLEIMNDNRKESYEYFRYKE